MANSYVQYTGTGAQTAYNVPFPYIDKSHVKVYLNNVLYTNYSWNNPSQITLAGAPANGVIVTIRRVTPSSPLVDFTAKSRWQTSDLNLSTRQALYIAEEAEEWSPTWLDGSGAPASSIGAQGDFYIDKTAGDLYRKGPSAWVFMRSIVGPPGQSFRILGSVASVGSLPTSGNTVGDSYLISGNLYTWNGSAWVNVGNITGPQGPAGASGAKGDQGDVGPAGADGSVWYSAAGAPSSGVGAVNDFYLNTTNGDYYKKTGVSTWTLQGNLTGPQGPQGLTGNTGLTGPKGDQGIQGLDGPEGPAGADGLDGGVKFTFSTTTTDADPGNGVIRANNSVAASVTQLYIDNVDADSNSMTAWLDSFDDSTTSSSRGFIYLRQRGSGVIAIYAVNGAVVDGSGYRKVPVAYVSGSLPSNNATAFLLFARSGNQGAAGAGSGDMEVSVYDTNADGKVNAADAADSAPWSGLTGVPSTFPPSSHSHPTSDITGLDTALANLQPLDADLTAIAALSTTGILKRTGAGTWALDTSTYSTVGHTHAQSDITGLTSSLAAKQDANAVLTKLTSLTDPNAVRLVYWNDGTNQFEWVTVGARLTLSGGTLSADVQSGGTWGSITGTLSSQTDLQTALNGKAASSHSHTISDVTGLAAALAAASKTTYTSGSGNWTIPSVGDWVLVRLWAAGGSGGCANTTTTSSGGGGGGYKEMLYRISALGSPGGTVAYSIGAGGAARTGTTLTGNVGGNTTFGSLTAYGGGPGKSGGFGGGGGLLGAGGDATPGSLGTGSGAGASALYPEAGGNGGATTAGGNSEYGGGGGGGRNNSNSTQTSGGLSLYGGNGGSGGANGVNGSAPGGGGGGAGAGGTSGAGADGRIEIYVW